MAKKDKSFSALETVHAALKPLKAEDRLRVLASVNALLEIPQAGQLPPKTREGTGGGGHNTPTRPLAIRELIQDKHPKTHPQFITLFAYYREKYQNLAAAWMIVRMSCGFQPHRAKKSGPCCGANFNGTPA